MENKRLQSDNDDLQHEFQRERESYLNTIRDYERRLLLFQTLITKMSHIMPRNCNYSNVERILQQARYDEDKNVYHLPDATREDVSLPNMGNNRSNNNQQQQQIEYMNRPVIDGYEDDFVESEEQDKQFTRNFEMNNIPPAERTRNKRQEQLLSENSVLQRAKRPLQINDNDYMNRRLNPYDAPTRLSQKYGFSSNK